MNSLVETITSRIIRRMIWTELGSWHFSNQITTIPYFSLDRRKTPYIGPKYCRCSYDVLGSRNGSNIARDLCKFCYLDWRQTQETMPACEWSSDAIMSDRRAIADLSIRPMQTKRAWSTCIMAVCKHEAVWREWRKIRRTLKTFIIYSTHMWLSDCN